MRSLKMYLEGILSKNYDGDVRVMDVYNMYCITKIPMLDASNTHINKKFMQWHPTEPDRHYKKNTFGKNYYMRYIWDWIASLPLESLDDNIQKLFDTQFPKAGLKLVKDQFEDHRWGIGIFIPCRNGWMETFKIEIRA